MRITSKRQSSFLSSLWVSITAKYKRRRLPNGFGQISEIKNRNLRNPFRAMISVGKDSNGRPICKPLKPESYFPTYNDAYAALVEYNKNPYDLEPSITMKELYEKWLAEYEKTVKSTRSVASAWGYCSAVYDMRVKDVRARHVKGCMDEGISKVRGKEKTPSASMKNQIKSLFNLMLDYALEYGWRPQELGLLELKNVDLENWTFRGGIKTDAGTDRVVPIHSKIRHLVERKYKEAQELGSLYLLNYVNSNARSKNTALTYARYQKGFGMIRDELNLNPEHRPHDGRKHFVTMAKKYGVDEYAIKYMVGHKISDITEKVYTQREFEWLKDEIEKIK